MLLDIDTAVFEVDENGPALDVLRMVAERRHDWRPTLPQAIRTEAFVEEVAAVVRIPALSEWAQQAVQESAYPAASTADPVVVCPANLPEIAADLGLPAVLVVENRKADGAFIQRVAAVLDGERIVQAVRRDWLRISHGGGNTQIAWLVADECRSFRHQFRVAALLDFDEGPESTSNKQAREIREAGLADVHVWAWRSVENYVPFNAWQWHVRDNSQRMARLQELRETRPEQRGSIKIRDRLGTASPLIPHQVTVTEADFRELGPEVVDELRRVLAMIDKIL